MFCGNGSVCRPPRRRRAFSSGSACRPDAPRRRRRGTSLTGEPGNNDAGEDAEDDFADQARHHVADARAGRRFVVAAQEGIDEVADDARQGRRRRCSPRPGSASTSPCRRWRRARLRGRVRLRPLPSTCFATGRWKRRPGAVLRGAGGKGVWLAVVDGDFGHGDAGALRKAFDGLYQPEFGRVARTGDDACAGAPLRHRLRHEERDEGAAEAHQRREDEQRARLRPLAVRNLLTPKRLAVMPRTSMTAGWSPETG